LRNDYNDCGSDLELILKLMITGIELLMRIFLSVLIYLMRHRDAIIMHRFTDLQYVYIYALRLLTFSGCSTFRDNAPIITSSLSDFYVHCCRIINIRIIRHNFHVAMCNIFDMMLNMLHILTTELQFMENIIARLLEIVIFTIFHRKLIEKMLAYAFKN